MKVFDLRGKSVWVAGHHGMVGSALARRLQSVGARLITIDRQELDLRRQNDVEQWLARVRPDAVFVAAATVGGIEANRTRPAEFLYDNIMIAANIIHAAASESVRKLMFLGSSCFYPRDADQPLHEDSLLTAPLEPTNEWYAIAKIAGVKLCQAYRRQFGKDFISAVPTNLYGPEDNFEPSRSHVIPALLRKVHEAMIENRESVEIWGTGNPLREFLYVDDAADGLVFLMEHYSDEQIVNVAGGEEISIREVAALAAEVVGYKGKFVFDSSRPDGMPRKVLDPSRLRAMGWIPSTPLRTGVTAAYKSFLTSIVK